MLYGNDVRDDRAMTDLAAHDAEGKIVAVPGPGVGGFTLLMRASYLARFFNKVRLQLAWAWEHRNEVRDAPLSGFIEENPDITELTDSYLRELVDEVRRSGAEIILTAVPSKERTLAPARRTGEPTFSDKARAWAEANGVPFVDLEVAFYAAADAAVDVGAATTWPTICANHCRRSCPPIEFCRHARKITGGRLKVSCNRREVVETLLLGGAGMAFGGATAFRGNASVGSQGDIVPFLGATEPQFDAPYGSGLGGRLVHDLSKLTPDTLVTPNDKFFIRTRKPGLLDASGSWNIKVGGMVREPFELSLDDLLPLVEPQGVHVFECSGNPRRRGFGLLGAAAWSGIPMSTVLDRIPAQRGATHVLVQGFDEHTEVAGGTPGASWVFTPEQLDRTGAFLATEMNGETLPEDHGYPVRLYVPGWYGCCCAKWIDRIDMVDGSFPATAQMKEYANRTHQNGIPEVAAGYGPANMDFTAMPVRVERRRVGNGLRYLVTGIGWGGERLADKLMIRFNDDEPYMPVEDFAHQSTTTWNLWTHWWDPPGPGRYTIRLQVDDPNIPTRRLDRGYYVRRIEIAQQA